MESHEQLKHYVGQFYIDGASLSGTLVYNRKNGVIHLSIDREIEGITDTPRNLDYVCGKLSTGSFVTLFNVRCLRNHTHGFQLQRLLFEAEYVIWGHRNVENQKFNKLECTIENGLAWSGLSQIKCEDLSSITFSGSGAESDQLYEWYGASIRFCTHVKNDFWRSPRKEDCKIVERLVIQIESKTKESFEYFLQVRNKILALISFAIKDNVNVEEQFLIDYDESFTTGPITQYYHFHILTNEPYHTIYTENHFDYNFFLKQLPISDDLSDKLTKSAVAAEV